MNDLIDRGEAIAIAVWAALDWVDKKGTKEELIFAISDALRKAPGLTEDVVKLDADEVVREVMQWGEKC